MQGLRDRANTVVIEGDSIARELAKMEKDGGDPQAMDWLRATIAQWETDAKQKAVESVTRTDAMTDEEYARLCEKAEARELDSDAIVSTLFDSIEVP
mgnify:CR=1 FL=1